MAQLYSAGGDVLEVFQCVSMATFVGLKLAKLSPSDVPPGIRGPVLVYNGALLFGSTAVCRFLMTNRSRDLVAPAHDELLEWEERVLRPAVLAGDAVAATAALSTLEERLQGDAGLGSPLADTVIGVTVGAALARFGCAGDFPKCSAFGKDVSAAAEACAALMPRQVDTSGTLEEIMNSIFQVALEAAFPDFAGHDAFVADVKRSKQYQHADYQCNNAMRINKELKGSHYGTKSPRDVAQLIVKNIPANDLVKSCEVAGPGFINVRLTDGALASRVCGILRDGGLRWTRGGAQRILVDFSSPNIAKEMHVGHLRSTIIGDLVCRLFEFCGHEVSRINHVGDWGTQFGMLIRHILDEYPDIENSPPDISDLTALYKRAKVRFDEEPDFKEAARQHVVLLQSGDATCRKVWNLLCDISRVEFDKVYRRLDIRLEEFGESYYNPIIPGVIEELLRAKIAEEFEGALCIFQRPKWEIPLIVRKSDGGFGYDSTDMAALSHRLRTLDQDRVVYVTDAGQANHFYMCFDAARKAQWTRKKGGEARLDHIGFGVVCGDDGKRFKTRSGETVKLVSLLDEAVSRFGAGLRQRKEEGKCHLSDEEIAQAAAHVGYGAVKYFDLKQDPASDYIFNYDRMLDPRGNSAVYLNFAFARVSSILRKAQAEKGVDVDALEAAFLRDGAFLLGTPQERHLAFQLNQFEDVLIRTVNDLKTHSICDFLYETAVVCTDFLTQCYVLGCEEERLFHSRLMLCRSTINVMRQAFQLLGMVPLEKM